MTRHRQISKVFDREQVLAFRLDSHNLARWLSPGSLLPAAAACGIQNAFLPPHEPYLQLRDRATLVPDIALRRRLWRSSGNPGIVLVDGHLVATWRPRKAGQRLKLVVELFTPVSQKVRSQLKTEAATLAPYRRCTTVEVEFR